jgi:GNAT superfamily N-acetyltransferase
MVTADGVSVRGIEAHDHARWTELYRGYREFYHLTPDDAVIERVWGWVTDPAHEVKALVASIDGRVVGLAHYRRFSRPSSGTVGLFLDDLFADRDLRGQGVGRALLGELSRLSAQDGYSVVRWITAADNSTARRLYDATATTTSWVTYDLGPGTL